MEAKMKTESPNSISSPCFRIFWEVGMPFTKTPFLLFKSTIVNSFCCLRIAQCLRESSGSTIAIELDLSLPIDISCSPREKVDPFSGPNKATRLATLHQVYLVVRNRSGLHR